MYWIKKNWLILKLRSITFLINSHKLHVLYESLSGGLKLRNQEAGGYFKSSSAEPNELYRSRALTVTYY